MNPTFGLQLGDAKTRLLVPAWNPVARSVDIYKTAHHPRLRTDYKSLAVDAATATAAAPTYFRQHVTWDAAGLTDGGTWANNPTALAIVEAIATLGWPRDSLHVLSLGCLDETYTIPKRAGIGTLGSKILKLFRTRSEPLQHRAPHGAKSRQTDRDGPLLAESSPRCRVVRPGLRHLRRACRKPLAEESTATKSNNLGTTPKEEAMPDGKAIKNAILDGIHAANVRYEKWSRGWWVTDSGVEGHVVSTIAETLNQRITGQGSLAMELPFGIIRKASGATPPPGRPRKTLNSRNRADIVLRDMNDRPLCVIEVKRFWDEEKCFEDLVRIRNLILRCNRKKGGSLGRGFLGFMLAAWETDDMSAEQSLEIAERYIRQRVRTQFDREGLRMKCHTGPIRSYPRKYRKLHSEGRWAHASFCVELSLR